MNKRAKNQKPNNQKPNNQKPIILISLNLDEIGYKSEDELQSISDRLNKNLRLARSRRESDLVKNIEKEICYVQRERDIRVKRRKKHEFFSNKR